MSLKRSLNQRFGLADRVERLAVWFESPPRWWRIARISAALVFWLIIGLALLGGWRPNFRLIAFYFLIVTVISSWRRNRRLMRDNAYLADRLARVEPVPIKILDGLGRDINHLGDAEQVSR
jgi:hypothetical protein